MGQVEPRASLTFTRISRHYSPTVRQSDSPTVRQSDIIAITPFNSINHNTQMGAVRTQFGFLKAHLFKIKQENQNLDSVPLCSPRRSAKFLHSCSQRPSATTTAKKSPLSWQQDLELCNGSWKSSLPPALCCLRRCHQKRNIAAYEGHLDVSDALLTELVRIVALIVDATLFIFLATSARTLIISADFWRFPSERKHIRQLMPAIKNFFF